MINNARKKREQDGWYEPLFHALPPLGREHTHLSAIASLGLGGDGGTGIYVATGRVHQSFRSRGWEPLTADERPSPLSETAPLLSLSVQIG